MSTAQFNDANSSSGARGCARVLPAHKSPRLANQEPKWEIQQENETARSEQNSFCSSGTQSRENRAGTCRTQISHETSSLRCLWAAPQRGGQGWERSLAQPLGSPFPTQRSPSCGFGVTPFPPGIQGAPVTDLGHKMGITRMVWEISLHVRLKIWVFFCGKAFPSVYSYPQPPGLGL